MYQLKEDVLAVCGNVRVDLVCQTPFDEPRAPRGETELVRRLLAVVVVVAGACTLSKQTRDDVRGERRAQVSVLGSHNEALEERRPYRDDGRRGEVRPLERRTFPKKIK